MTEEQKPDTETSKAWADSLGKWMPALLSLLGAAGGALFNWVTAAIVGGVVLILAIYIPKALKDKAYHNNKEENAGQIGTDVGNQNNALEENREAGNEFLGRK